LTKAASAAAAAVGSTAAMILSISLVPRTASTSGELVEQIDAVSLDQAACDNQSLAIARILERSHLENRINRFLLGGLDKTARIDDDHVGILLIGRQLIAVLRKLTHHDLAIDEVLRASKADKAYFLYFV
jgi:hypothetical protein